MSDNRDRTNYNNLRGYNGNPLIKRERVEVQWTKELVEEYIKCSEDPIYFVETYMKIINVDDGLVPFKLYDYQKDILLSLKNQRKVILATARQIGKSTTTCAFILWYILFNQDKTVALLANKGETAREILGKIQLAYQHLPKWLQHGVLEWNKGSFELENNSRVIAAATSSDSIRGYAINMLFVDECAFIDHWEEFWASTMPTISSGKTTKIVLVSTPKGLNHFYKLWSHAIEGKNDFHPIKVMWYDVPGRDETWKQSILAALAYDYEQFEQENEVQFLGSSGTLISSWKLKELTDKIPLLQKNGVYQYEKPIKGHIYCMSADTSRGKGLDYSAFQLIDITSLPYKQVLVYRDNFITPIDYADIMYQTAKMYNDATMLIEINDIGQQVADYIFYEYEYEHVISTVNAGRLGKKVSGGFSPNTDRGIRTTKNVKSIGCSIAKLLIEQNQLIVNDWNTINELSTFSKKGVSFEAEEGCHDDLVMALVLFGWLTDQSYFKELNNLDTLSKLRDKTDEQIMQDMIPFGIISDGREDYPADDSDSPYSPTFTMDGGKYEHF
jgi:hypothetical protein